jgi:putative transcriptional regulator
MNRIKQVLEEKQLTQMWLATKLGKSYNMVNSYVQNRRQPSIELLFQIGKILKTDPKDLLISKKAHK